MMDAPVPVLSAFPPAPAAARPVASASALAAAPAAGMIASLRYSWYKQDHG